MGANRTVLSRMHGATPGGGLLIDPATELVILEFPQPFDHHNGGRVDFGPDGMLYLGLGDGGVENNGQDIEENLLGSVIRIDVSGATAQQPYTIPPGNPFAGTPGARGETWATGIRNPWRMAFDPVTGVLWLADVGEAAPKRSTSSSRAATTAGISAKDQSVTRMVRRATT